MTFGGAKLLTVSQPPKLGAIQHTIPMYLDYIAANMRGWPMVFGICCLAGLAWALYRRTRPMRGSEIYISLLAGSAVVLSELKFMDPRYLFHAQPALLAIAYACLWSGLVAVMSERWARIALLAFAAVWFGVGLTWSGNYMLGASEAASVVARKPGARVVYAGDAIGSFVFAMRERDPNLTVTVIQARRLPPGTLRPNNFENFRTQYGIDWVIVENNSPLRWFIKAPLPAAEPVNEVQMRGTMWNGSLYIYRFPPPSRPPGKMLSIPIPKMGGSIDVWL
jgi:hypothetical protein